MPLQKDDYLEILKKQYREEIHEAVLESKHPKEKQSVDSEIIEKLKRIQTAAKVDGLGHEEFLSLLKEAAEVKGLHLSLDSFQE